MSQSEMMVDLENVNKFYETSVDVCIIGAGPAGITIANELRGSGLTVCLAESGGFNHEERTQNLYRGNSIGHPVRLTEGRHRILGGAATKWGGRCAQMDPIDFEARSWIKHAEWPISWNTIEAYYPRAKLSSNFKGSWLNDDESLAAIGKTVPRFKTADINPFVWRHASPYRHMTIANRCKLGFGPAFDWGLAYRSELSSDTNVTLILHANLVDLTPADMADSVRMASFKSLNGNELSVMARVFIICCSGIENVRILLNLSNKIPNSLHGHANLGRFFTQHPRGPILTIEATKAETLRLQNAFNFFAPKSSKSGGYELGFALSESAQREHKILNASASIYYTASENSAWAAGRRLRDALKKRSLYKDILADTGCLLKGGANLIANAWSKYVSGGQIILPACNIQVKIDLEQEPRNDSCITLADTVDELGVRQVTVDWKLSEIERKTSRYFAEALSQEFQHLGFGKARLEPWLTSSEPILEEHLAGNYHFIGATRMARTSETGVVDENAKVFGVSNLYVAGSSVFSTGGHANPTLTIVALAIRLSDYIKSTLTERTSRCA